MECVNFGRYNSFRDFNIILSSKSIGSPDVKTMEIEVPGADGKLDFTEYFGEQKYKNRKLSFSFSMAGQQADQLYNYSRIKGLLHGKKMQIKLDADKMYYYVGRLNVSDLSNNKNIYTFKIDADCEPYKYKINKTIVKNEVNGSKRILLMNDRKKVVPKIKTSANIQVLFNGDGYDFDAGEHVIDDIVLVEGVNEFIIYGYADITFEYQEGSL